MNLTELFRYVVSLSLLGSVLVIGLFIVKLLFKQKLSASWHYYIWLVLILRLIIPFTPTSPFSVFNLLPQPSPTFHVPQAISPPSISPAATPSVPDTISTGPTSLSSGGNISNPPSPTGMLGFNWATAAIVWLTGVLAILLYIFVVNGLLLLKIRKYPVCENADVAEILEECRDNLNVHTKVTVIYNDSLKSPALFGLFRPKIIVSPQLVSLLSREELRYIFLHELSHLKRRDLFVNILVTFVQVIYWFNPLVWYALHQMKQDCEMACDATALAALKPEDHKKYGRTIINMLQLLSEPHWAPGTLGFANKINTRRITMISTNKRTTLKWAAAALALTLVVGCSSLSSPLTPANNGQNQNNTTTNSPQGDTDLSPTGSIVYKDTQYGFSFALPESWKGYTIVSSPWEGLAQSDAAGETVVETGPIVTIRDPRWTSKTPRQDIPIMVFTLDQWNSLQQGVFHIGAAPIGPSELGRNNSYVFALPARYNFAFPPGYKEVETIIESNPLKTTPTAQLHPDSTDSLLFNMMVSVRQGKVLFSDFAAKTSTIADVEKAWGTPDKMDYVASAGGRYATYTSHNIVFGINKGDQIFEIRSYDSRLKGITLAKVKGALGTPAHNAKVNGQLIIGYAANSEFKVEMVFPEPTNANPNPVLDHYNVLYPNGTVNSMSGYPGRQW